MDSNGPIGVSTLGTKGRFMGGISTSGSPSSGTYQQRDYMIDAQGFVWVCTSAGSPGSWQRTGGESFRYIREAGIVSSASDQGAAINSFLAASAGKLVLLDPNSTYVTGQTLVLQDRSGLKGGGPSKRSSTIKVANGANCIAIKNFQSPDGIQANAMRVVVQDLLVDGNKANQSAGLWHGIQYSVNPTFAIATNDLDYDSHQLIENVEIINCKGNGYDGNGRSEMRLINVTAQFCDNFGFTGSFDTFYISCTASNSGSNGFRLDDSSERLVNCKSFYSGKLSVDGSNGHGFLIVNGQGGINLTNCEAQDNAGAGFALNGAQRSIIQSCVADSNSSKHVNATVNAGDWPAVDIWDSYYNIIDVVAYERAAYDTVSSYQLNALQIRNNSTNNRIRMVHSAYTFGGATIGAFVKSGSNAVGGNDISFNNDRGTQFPAFAASYTPVFYSGGTIHLGAMTANLTINNAADKHIGMTVTFVLTQDATGSRTVTWGSDYVTSGWAVTSTANSVSFVTFTYNGTKFVRVG